MVIGGGGDGAHAHVVHDGWFVLPYLFLSRSLALSFSLSLSLALLRIDDRRSTIDGSTMGDGRSQEKTETSGRSRARENARGRGGGFFSVLRADGADGRASQRERATRHRSTARGRVVGGWVDIVGRDERAGIIVEDWVFFIVSSSKDTIIL